MSCLTADNEFEFVTCSAHCVYEKSMSSNIYLFVLLMWARPSIVINVIHKKLHGLVWECAGLRCLTSEVRLKDLILTWHTRTRGCLKSAWQMGQMSPASRIWAALAGAPFTFTNRWEKDQTTQEKQDTCV